MAWHFSPQPADQVETEITQRDQFNNDDVGLAESLVREVVQNSLDAGIDSSSEVRVTFNWVNKDDGLDPSFLGEILEDQIEHAEVAGLDRGSLDFANPEALIIEDYGTSGLIGSTTEKDNRHFSDFWRRHGKAHKSGKKRGRWGLGKLVYSTTSRIGVFFGLTVRVDDNRPYLMGQTVLGLRTVNGAQYLPHAFYSDLDHKEDNLKRIPVPIKSGEKVNKFIKNFSLRNNGEPGLSVIIPFPNKNFKSEQMIGFAISSYFYPLMTGQLVLQFNGTEINKKNVRENAKKYASKIFQQIDVLFDFIDEVSRVKQGELLQLKSSWIDDELLNEDDPDVLNEIKRQFLNGELVGVSLPVTIELKDGSEKKSSFSVYIKRPQELQKGLDLYIRDGLRLPGETKFGDRRALGAMIAEEEPICAFLGDAENPAHTRWVASAEKLAGNYKTPKSLVTKIRKSVIQLYDFLAEVIEEEHKNVLRDTFYFYDSADKKGHNRRKGRKPQTSVSPIKKKQPDFNIYQIEGGFTITNTIRLTNDKLPKELIIEAAYAVTRGNAFKKYSPFDFKFGNNGNIKIFSAEGIKEVHASGNKWTFSIDEIPFKLSVVGFDKSRDLKIKVS